MAEQQSVEPQKRGRGRPPALDGQSVYHVDLKLTKEADQALNRLKETQDLNGRKYSRSTHTILAIMSWFQSFQTIENYRKEGKDVLDLRIFLPKELVSLLLSFTKHSQRELDGFLEDLIREQIQ